MRIWLFVGLMLMLGLAVSYPALAEEGWITSLDDGLKQAKDSNKLILVDFTATWCGWCKKLQTDVFEKDDFLKYAQEKLVLVSIDADQNRSLVDKYAVEGYPTILVLNAVGEKVHQIVGYMTLEKFMFELKEAESKTPVPVSEKKEEPKTN